LHAAELTGAPIGRCVDEGELAILHILRLSVVRVFGTTGGVS